jgi:hypothetical protein
MESPTSKTVATPKSHEMQVILNKKRKDDDISHFEKFGD